MPRIPVNPSDLPSSQGRFDDTPFDETQTYTATVELLGAVKQDVNKHEYFSVRFRVTEPEQWANRVVYDNYIGLPYPVEPNMNADDRKKAEQSGDRLGDLARSAEIEGSEDGWDTDELKGRTVRFTVKNEIYQGQQRPRPQSYLLPKEDTGLATS